MLSKDVSVEIDTKSWKKNPRPSWAKNAPLKQLVDIDEALLLLGMV